jgi:hypothetical protein
MLTLDTPTPTYAYRGDLYCSDCGDKIAGDLRRKGVEDDGDSNTFPQGPYPDGGGASDSAHFCGGGARCSNAVAVTPRNKVGCPLANPLTADGARAVRAGVAEDLMSQKKFSRLVGRLLRRVWLDTPSSELVQLPAWTNFPTSLEKLLGPYWRRGRITLAGVDDDHAYLTVAEPDQVTLLRAEVGDDGEFVRVDEVSVETSSAADRPPLEVVQEAVDLGAWD